MSNADTVATTRGARVPKGELTAAAAMAVPTAVPTLNTEVGSDAANAGASPPKRTASDTSTGFDERPTRPSNANSARVGTTWVENSRSPMTATAVSVTVV